MDFYIPSKFAELMLHSHIQIFISLNIIWKFTDYWTSKTV